MNVALITRQSRAGDPQAAIGAEPLDLGQRRRRAPKWHLIYYILALFDLATVSGSFYLTYSIMTIYTNSVEANQGWANHLASLTELGQKASAVNAPGNDIFDSHDVPREKRRQRAALETYGQLFGRLKASILRDVKPSRAEELRKRLDDIEVAMNDMLSETDLIFSYFSNNQAESAARHMASMDRKLANLSAVIAAASQSVRTIQSGLFMEQVAEAAYLRRYEYLFGGIILLMVACVTVYGHKIAHESKLREAERERYLDALRAAKTDAERANQIKSKFVTAVSHDLRQPLQTLTLGTALLARRVADPELRGIVLGMQGTLQSAGGMLRSLLDLARIESPDFAPEILDFALGPLLARVANDLDPQANAKGMDLRVVPTGAAARSSPALIESIVRNFVANAICHAETGRVLLGCRRRGDQVRIEVWDTGPGIPADKIDAIFQEYVQLATDAPRRTAGMGLGLSIVDRAARLLGHRIDVASRVGKGSMFAVEVPLAAAAAPQPGRSEIGDSELAGIRAAIIDDEAEPRLALERLLEDWGVAVLAGEDVEQVLAHLAGGMPRPDIIIADLHLGGGVTGIEAIRRLRQTYGADISAILITGETRLERLAGARDSGLRLLHKPADPAELRAAIATVLANSARRMVDA
jgi:signal transduction histidine kinase/CheY-like chemotaxis protein